MKVYRQAIYSEALYYLSIYLSISIYIYYKYIYISLSLSLSLSPSLPVPNALQEESPHPKLETSEPEAVAKQRKLCWTSSTFFPVQLSVSSPSGGVIRSGLSSYPP